MGKVSLFFILLISPFVAHMQSTDSTQLQGYNYEFNWGFGTHKLFAKSEGQFFPQRVKFDLRKSKYLLNNNGFNFKIGISNSVHKVQIGYFFYYSKYQKSDSYLRSATLSSNGIEFNYFALKYTNTFKFLSFTPFLNYSLNVGAYQRVAHTIHHFGLGGEFDLNIHKHFYLRNNTSIQYITHGFPMHLVSQFYIGVRF